MLTVAARLLGDAERAAVDRILDADPFVAAQVAERVAAVGVSWCHQDARMFGYGSRRRLESLCWVGTNVVPIMMTARAVSAFAGTLRREPRRCSSIVGSADGVLDLWRRLEPAWGTAREIRPNQPLLVADSALPVVPDPLVRLVRPDEMYQLYPAAVAMYLEEVGIPPAAEGDDSFWERTAELVAAGRTYARFLDGRVVFKAELAIVTRWTAQVQGVWTLPELRGRGIASRALAAVVADALRRVAPTVSLYVNEHNLPARALYDRCGFRRVGTLATVLF